MHMADALLSPAVGTSLWAATAATVVYSSRKLQRDLDEKKVPLMGVLGAFVFAAQMINFTIPGTGSSGHLGGGLLLAILLGPEAAFLTLASVLTVQALFFADGGLLALGANIFNLGFFPCYVAYPLLYRPIAGRYPSPGRIGVGAVLAAVVGLQLGALGVVSETVLSGISELSFAAFALLMQPVHLAIGVVEGLVTAAVVVFVWKNRPEVLEAAGGQTRLSGVPMRRILVSLGVVALVLGAGVSWFASTLPDGLEWSIARLTGSENLEPPEGDLRGTLAEIQEKTSFLPDYGLRSEAPAEPNGNASGDSWPAADPGTSLAGVVGGLLTVLIAVLVGWLLRRRSRPV